jgi:SAM-dependent methyltransferase
VRHPWEVARSQFFVDLIERHLGTSAAVRWLDVGAGDGWLGATIAAHLAPASSMQCWDVNYRPGELEELRAAHPDIEFGTDRPTGRFDVVSLLDVLEHIEDDQAFLGDLVESVMVPGGLAFVSVPAHPRLFGGHDVALHHFRRYRPGECRAVLRTAGLEIIDEGGLFWSLVPVRAVGIALERMRRPLRSSRASAGLGEWTSSSRVTSAVALALRVDVRLAGFARARGLTLPGLSYWAVAVRSGRTE